jgi:hypothetical protein
MTAPMASALAMLPSMSGITEVWQQRPEESAAEYDAFLEWLDLGQGRGSPASKHTSISLRHDWAERALAFEREQELAAADSATPNVEVQIVSNLTRMVQMEADKLVKQCASTTAPVISLNDLLKTINIVKEIQLANVAAAATTGAGPGAPQDLSRLTQAEKQQVLAAQLLLRKAQQK